MISFLTGYYDLGLRALSAARLGLSVTGDNIANAATPGFHRRRLELAPGFPMRVQGGYLDRGVDVQRISREADRFLQASIEREQGSLAGSEERLRGLREIEAVFGDLEGEGLAMAYTRFSDGFAALAGQPENLALRGAAISNADLLAGQIRSTYARLSEQQRSENDAISGTVAEINQLAQKLSELNREQVALEADGSQAGSIRDQQTGIIERLAELTGGHTFTGDRGTLGFSLPGGPTLVTGVDAIAIRTGSGTNGALELSAGGVDFTARLRGGELGALLELRDDAIPERLEALDALASDLITRANALTSGATDLDGNAGGPIFVPDPAPGGGAAASIQISAELLSDPRRLAISGDGTPGNGSVATLLAELQTTSSAGLGGRSPSVFLADMASSLANAIVEAEVSSSVSADLVETMYARRDAISGVSLDEEAIELVRYQQAYEAAARFIQVLNEVTAVALTIGE